MTECEGFMPQLWWSHLYLFYDEK